MSRPGGGQIPPSADPEREVFANNLRGCAAFLVLLSHFGSLFWFSRGAVRSLLLMPGFPPECGAPAETPAVFTVLNIFWPYFDFGALGVSLFFLISGFVIPFSLLRLDRAAFAAARFFRIYPLYWCALAVNLGALWLFSCPEDWKITPDHIIEQALLIRDWFIFPPLDGVSWSLEMEIKFYILCMIFAGFIRRGRVFFPAAAGLALFAVMLLTGDSSCEGWRFSLQYNIPVLIFMLAGVAFNFHRRGMAGGPASAVSVIFLVILSFWAFSESPVWGPHACYVYPGYSLGLVIFSVCYALRDRARRFRLLDFAADISYPLYLVHAVPGFIIMFFWLTVNEFISPFGRTLDPYFAVAAAVSFAVVTAWILNKMVEKPAMRLGKKVSALLTGRR
jgi:peptidoglycan/LPS O-acetylase OafA/YrhL